MVARAFKGLNKARKVGKASRKKKSVVDKTGPGKKSATTARFKGKDGLNKARGVIKKTNKIWEGGGVLSVRQQDLFLAAERRIKQSGIRRVAVVGAVAAAGKGLGVAFDKNREQE